MDINALRVAIRMLLNGMRPADLEKLYGFTHGFTARLVKKVREPGLTAEGLDRLTNEALEALYYGRRRKPRAADLSGKTIIRPDFAVLEGEFRASGRHSDTSSERKLELTREAVPDLYYFEDPENLRLVREGTHVFLSLSHCLKLWRTHVQKNVSPAYRVVHEPGASAEFDFTGVTIEYGGPDEGKRATFLVAVLPASGYIAVRAIESQCIGPVLDGMAACLRDFGGVPAVLTVDNFRGAVKKADRFGGEINEQFAAMAGYYGAGVLTARPATPKDKGTVEACVKYTTRFALARLRHYMKQHGPMHTLREINDFLAPLVERMNERRIRGIGKTRRELWEEEKKSLRQPAAWDYCYAGTVMVTVPPTGRIVHERHEYALPPEWINHSLMMELTASSVSFRSGTAVIATYARRDGEDGVSSSSADYIRENFLAYDICRIPCQEDMLIEWAAAMGPEVTLWCRDTLAGPLPWAQKVRRVLSVLNLPEAYTAGYALLDGLVGKLRVSSLYWPVQAGTIRSAWKDAPKSAGPARDTVHTAENHRKAGIAYIKGESSVMEWPSALGEESRKSGTGEFLNGSTLYASRYAEVEALMNGGGRAVSDSAA